MYEFEEKKSWNIYTSIPKITADFNSLPLRYWLISGVHMENKVFSWRGNPEISISGTVFPNLEGFCSVTIVGISNALEAAVFYWFI